MVPQVLAKDYTFTSARLRYRGVQKQDAELIVEWRSRPENYKNFFNARPLSLKDHLEWFERYLLDDVRFDFMIELLDGTPIGTCGLSSISEESCEISYMIGETGERGKGYGVEVIKALTEVAFKELEVEFVQACILPHNTSSQSVAMKAGYDECERVFRKHRNARLLKSEDTDL